MYMQFLLLYCYISTAIFALIFVNFIINNYLFKNIAGFSKPGVKKEKFPLVSVLIPARNEGKNIKRCLRSLIRQDYPNLEIIVLDDNSTDNTSGVVKEFAAKTGKIRLILGEPLIGGWLGKSFACHQLSKAARGNYLLFTDADTLHFKKSVTFAINALNINKLDAISVFARQITVTIHERMMVPFANFFLLAFMPFILILKSKNPLFCTAIGQFMLFKRCVYEKIGGHGSVKSEILEDIHIAKHVKRAGYKFMIFDGRNNFYCRMYNNLKEVVAGYSKVLSAAFNYNLALQGFITVFVFIFLLMPFMVLPLAILILEWPQVIINLLIIQAGLILSLKIFQTIRFRDRFIDIFLLPVSFIYLIMISVHSMIKSKSTCGVFWKGRVYDVRKEDELRLVKENLK